MEDIWGTIYILKFHQPIGGEHPKGKAQFYVGWCGVGRLKERLREHRNGQGAAIMRFLKEQGIGFDLVVCFSGTRRDERRVKKYGNTRLYVQRRTWERRWITPLPYI